MAASEVVAILLLSKCARGTPSAECSDNYRAKLTYNEGSTAQGNDLLLVSKDGLTLAKMRSQRVKMGSTSVRMSVTVQGFFGIGISIFSAILTNSATESAAIFRISWLRWTLTEASLLPMASAICLLRRPETTQGSTSRSRGVSDSKRSLNTAISASCWCLIRSLSSAS